MRSERALKLILALAWLSFAIFPAQLASAQSGSESYQLPAPWHVASDQHHRSHVDYEPPAPRRGLVLQGYRYDRMRRSIWASQDLRRRAEDECEGRVTFPALPSHESDRPRRDRDTISEFWLIISLPETLLIERKPRIVAVEDCEAQYGYEMSITRSFQVEDLITIRSEDSNRTWLRTRPIDEELARATHGFLPVTSLRELRERNSGKSLGTERNSAGIRVECFNRSQYFDFRIDCHLAERGRFAGLLLRSEQFHTASIDDGIIVTDLHLNTWIDGRLFEWDREISLEPIVPRWMR